MTGHDAAVLDPDNRVVLDIEGMTCASCVTKVERALGSVDGVTAAAVNLATRQATVQAAGPTPSMDGLVRAVVRVGYGARPHTHDRPADEEERSYRRRLMIAVPGTLAVLACTFLVPASSAAMVMAWVFATPVQFVAGWPFLRSAARSARHGTTTMDTLVAVGSLAAYAYSAWVVTSALLEGTMAGEVGHYFDTGAVIITLILVGKVLEARARSAAGDASRALLERAATHAMVLEADGTERRIAMDEVRPGMRVVVRPGETFPADGVVKEGASWIDLSVLTGESVPVDVGPGDEVVGAAINGHGRLVVFVTTVGANTHLSRIVRLLQAAQASKAPVQRLADRISAVFVPIVLILAALTWVGWATLGGLAVGPAMLRAAAVVLIACPCALGLATPAAIMAGTGRAAELGVLFTGGEVFEAARGADTVLLDKTGTVTRGVMTVDRVQAAAGATSEDVLRLAAAVETGSEHPIARAVVTAARDRGLEVPVSSEHRVAPGSGATALVAGSRVEVGRADQLPDDLAAEADAMARRGATVSAVRRDRTPIGLIGVADALREEAPAAVERLHAMGLDVAIVTGDRGATADAVAAATGVPRVVAEVLPGGKVDEVVRLQAAGRTVVFVGDGINDAPALAAADVGVAMGSGTDVAIAAADVQLLGGTLRALPLAIELARRTYRIIQQNLFWAFAYNVVMIPLAIAGMLDPMLAAAAMALSSVSVVLNALRLRRFGNDRDHAAVHHTTTALAGAHEEIA